MSVNSKTLVLDAGNTALKWTLFDAGEVSQKWTSDTPPDVTPERIIIASVRSAAQTHALQQLLSSTYANISQTQVHTETAVCGVQNSYAEPERLGVDRWLAAISAYRDYGGPCVVVDAGTAIKVEFIDAKGLHLGGYIVPGLELMSSSLVANTARIRFTQAEISANNSIPNSTADAVSQGCLQMALGFLQRIYAQHSEATWLVTGGTGRELMSLLNLPCIMDEHLVAKGAYYVANGR
ncbi:type III pantothenate kinase [Marinomonas ostreistagni]|uniref:type III pantothenate kinase n=1 Tax=Marinomonas ostreistagni TaxID=359209 RepID=UPI00194DE056|nr:type III pantothenate kinase [Marinomonas ostreistagni]